MNPLFWLAIGLVVLAILAVWAGAVYGSDPALTCGFLALILALVPFSLALIQDNEKEARLYTEWCNSKGGTVVDQYRGKLCVSADGRILT